MTTRPTDPREALADADAEVYTAVREHGYHRATVVALVQLAEQQQRTADALERIAEQQQPAAPATARPDRIPAVLVTILAAALLALLLAAFINDIA